MSFFKFKMLCLLVCLCGQAGLAGATAIYRSVGPGQTAALATGGANGLSLFGSTASFAVDLPDNIGVGDVIQYDADNNGVAEELAFITNRNNGGSYTVQNASGSTPPMTQGGAGDQDWAIYRAYTSLANAETGTENTGILAGLRDFDTWSGGQDLTSNGDSWHVACYADNVDTTPVAWDGWTTSSSDYIRLFVPYQTDEVGTSQRHSGVWDTNAYRLEVTTGTALETSSSYIRVEGLQLRVVTVNGNGYGGFRLDSQTGTADVRISHCLIRGYDSASSYSNHNGIDINNSGSGEVKIWNNIIYDFNTTTSSGGIRCNDGGFTFYIYNNTIFNCYEGFNHDSGTLVLKNNIAQDCTDGYSGTFDAASDYNLSDLAGDAPGTNARNAQPVIFESEAIDDFHLGSTDDGAKAMGVDLSGDFDWPINDDIDNEARSGTWDIGADEYPLATMIFRSVGPGNTTALDTGSGNEMIITGDSAVFTLALPDTVGIGDALQYDSDNNGSVDAIVFVSERKSATNLIVKTASGGNPSGTAADEDWSIYRAYTSLSNIESGNENTGINAGLRNFDTWSGGRNMVLNNEIWTVACYNDGVDTTAVFWDGWTTGLENYVSIMTPTSFLEAGTSQRHQGTWTTDGYRLSVSNNTAIHIQDNYIHLEGLQIQVASVNGDGQKAIAITAYSGTGRHDISYNIIRGVATVSNDWHTAISIWNSDLGTVRIWNNMIYDFNSATSASAGGIEINDVQYTIYAYNNTIHNCRIGAWQRTGNFVVKNMIVQDCVNGYEAVNIFDASSTNNVSDLPADAPGTSALNSTTIVFADEASDDFHLSDLDNQARNTGVDLQFDSALAFSDDIDQQLRSIWDRGADENINPMLTPTNTVTLTTTISPTISATLTASPSISPTNTMTPTRTATPTPTHTPPETPTISPTVTVTPTVTPTCSITMTATVSPTPTITLTISPTTTASPTSTITPEMELPDDLSEALVYPNPYRREVKPLEEISFHNLPRLATIKIYTINGQIVKVIEKNSPFPWERWNLKNEQGGKIASGIYIYIVKAGQAEKKGKFAIIK